jgi:hypothetical protein
VLVASPLTISSLPVVAVRSIPGLLVAAVAAVFYPAQRLLLLVLTL